MIPTERLFYTLVDVTRELNVTAYEESLTSRRQPNVPSPVDLAAALAIVSNAWFKQFLGELQARVPHRALAIAEVAEKAPDALPVPAALALEKAQLAEREEVVSEELREVESLLERFGFDSKHVVQELTGAMLRLRKLELERGGLLNADALVDKLTQKNRRQRRELRRLHRDERLRAEGRKAVSAEPHTIDLASLVSPPVTPMPDSVALSPKLAVRQLLHMLLVSGCPPNHTERAYEHLQESLRAWMESLP